MLVIEHDLDDLVGKLEKDGKKLKKAQRYATIDGGSAAKRVSINSILARGNYRRAPGAASRIRKGTYFKPDYDTLGGVLSSTTRAESLVHWTVGRAGPKMNYKGRGVQVKQGEVFEKKYFTRHAAFVRNLGGKKQLLWREGHRSIGGVYKAIPGSRLLTGPVTSDETIEAYHQSYTKTFVRNYYKN